MRVSIWTILVCFAVAAFGPMAAAQELTLDSIAKLAERGNRVQALRQLDSFLEARPSHFEALLLKGNLLAEIGQTASAEAIYGSLIEAYPRRPEAFNNLAVLQAREGRFEEAADNLLGALETHPSYRVAYENLGKVYGQFASQAYSKALGVQSSEASGSLDLTLLSNPLPIPEASPSLTAEPPSASLASQRPQVELPQASASQTSTAPPVQHPPMEATESQSRTEPPRALPSPPTQAQASQTTAPETLTAPSPDAQSLPSQHPTVPPPAEAGVASAVRSWARAWSEQRVDDYLSFYSPSFRPQGGLARTEWASQRRSRLQSPTFIRVVLRNLLTPVIEGDRAIVTFIQSYSSDNYADVVEKRLVLRREAGEWRIVEEVTEP